MTLTFLDTQPTELVIISSNPFSQHVKENVFYILKVVSVMDFPQVNDMKALITGQVMSD